jgi:hypothetical protein
VKITYFSNLANKHHDYSLQIKPIIMCLIFLIGPSSIILLRDLSERNIDARSPENFTQHDIFKARIQNELSNQSNPCGTDPRDLSCNPTCNPWESGCSLEIQSAHNISDTTNP